MNGGKANDGAYTKGIRRRRLLPAALQPRCGGKRRS